MNDHVVEIPRHKTAIRRDDFSRPVKCLIRDDLIGPAVSIFDYGCGRGEDLELLTERGVPFTGWDPAYRPDASVQEADVVNLGYVINVIEKPDERAATLRRAWSLCRRLLVVSAQVLMAGRGKTQIEFGDGVLTGRGTFQKYYEQSELKAFLESEVEAEAIPAEIGIYYLFKDESAREQFLANRFRRRELLPRIPRQRISKTDRTFQENRELLESLMAATAAFGRLPETDEFPRSAEVIEKFGSLKRAFGLVRRITGDEQWEQIARRRTEDILVYLALARFKRRPQFTTFPWSLQLDIRSFFGNYTKACAQADELLFKAGDAAALDEACKRSKVGKLLPDDLYVHRDALPSLEPLLRIYEGCGRAYLGEVEGANLIKIHRRTGKLSYLVYPEFDTDPHPALVRCVKLNLRTRQLECYDYAESKNPPVLHRKETFLGPDDERSDKFARLTAQEEKAGLLEDTATIGTRDGWRARLSDRGYALKGHRLVKRRAAGDWETRAVETERPVRGQIAVGQPDFPPPRRRHPVHSFACPT